MEASVKKIDLWTKYAYTLFIFRINLYTKLAWIEDILVEDKKLQSSEQEICSREQ